MLEKMLHKFQRIGPQISKLSTKCEPADHWLDQPEPTMKKRTLSWNHNINIYFTEQSRKITVQENHRKTSKKYIAKHIVDWQKSEHT